MGKEGVGAGAGAGLLKQRLITSDYESSDSPNSSDLSDNMGTMEDGGGSVPRKVSAIVWCMWWWCLYGGCPFHVCLFSLQTV